MLTTALACSGFSACARGFGASLSPSVRRVPPPRASTDDERESNLWALYEEETGASMEEDSHLHLELDEDGAPVKARFTYVDEHSCIGCTYCTQVARNTFALEDDHGRARVYDQHGDDDDTIQEAIDSCPVNCIHFVSHEDLVTLELERQGQFINNKVWASLCAPSDRLVTQL